MWVSALKAVAVPAWLMLRSADGANCYEHSYCNGHGTCVVSTSSCQCYEGWGAETDIALRKAADCSLRACPSARAWTDVPTAENAAHAIAECSNQGVCDSATGTCKCFDGFEGDACQRMACPNDCSGHGRCVNLKEMAIMDDAMPLTNKTYTYEGSEVRCARVWFRQLLKVCSYC